MNLQGNLCFLCLEGGWLPSSLSLILLFSHTLPPCLTQWLDFPPGGGVQGGHSYMCECVVKRYHQFLVLGTVM